MDWKQLERTARTEASGSLIKNGIFGLAILLLFPTGAHTEVIAFVQRGLLKTGLMDPKVESIMEASDATETEGTNVAPLTKADFNLRMVDINGEQVSMEQFCGKVIFINVWATWCPLVSPRCRASTNCTKT